MSATHVQQTSAQALAAVPLGARQAAVRSAVAFLGTACNQLIADHLGVPVNQVTGRVFELRDMGVLRESHRGIWTPTGRNVIWWETV
jgi:L-alanine-DL-glutamate epimerase-like enolase superfamily enzyme